MSSPLRSVRPQPSCNDQVLHILAWNKPSIYNPTTSHQTRCYCSCGCACCNNSNKDDENILETSSSPPRGRSLTPKFDRTNGGNNRPIPTSQKISLEPPSWPPTTSPTNSQEGLATHQIEQQQHAPLEINDLDTHAHASIHLWLEQHHSQTHSHSHGFFFAHSTEASMLVESSTMAPSVASSDFLPPRVVASAADLLSFATGGFDGGGEVVEGKMCAFTPLWLTHERRYCRGAQVEGGGGGAVVGYPAAVDLFGGE